MITIHSTRHNQGQTRPVSPTQRSIQARCGNAQSPAQRRPIECSIAGPGLLEHQLVGKFADHLPPYRHSVIYAHKVVDLDRALQASWVGAASGLLRPLNDAIHKRALASAKPHADDTPVPVLALGTAKPIEVRKMLRKVEEASTPRIMGDI